MILIFNYIGQNEGGETKKGNEGKKSTKTVDLPIREVVKAQSPSQLNANVERESQMVQADKLENERINAKVSVCCNALVFFLNSPK